MKTYSVRITATAQFEIDCAITARTEEEAVEIAGKAAFEQCCVFESNTEWSYSPRLLTPEEASRPTVRADITSVGPDDDSVFCF